jgi:molybdopterin molybdotransferase
MSGLLNVDDALKHILQQIDLLQPDYITINDALGRVLSENVVSDLDLPPFRSSSVDGFGVRVEDVQFASQNNPAILPVARTVQAGDHPIGFVEGGVAVRIMTGAPVPDGISAVIPIENTDADWYKPNVSVSIYKSAQKDDNIRPIGENVKWGQPIFSAGDVLRPVDIGMLASIGRDRVRVIGQPHVVVISTGDELVDVGNPLPAGKIYQSNGHLLSALITEFGGRVTQIPIVKDTREAVRSAFEQALTFQPTMIISSGGVSVGALDYVRVVLEEMGQVDFWRINLKPGKPLAFGHLDGVPFFGLPGNPVSVWVTFDIFVRPALCKQVGRKQDVTTGQAILKKSVKSDGRRTYMSVKLSVENGQLYADRMGTQSSGALMSMVLADGLLIIPEGVDRANEGDVYPVRLLRKIEML